MRNSGGTVSILWLNNCCVFIDINQIAEAKIKVLLKKLAFCKLSMFSEMF
jgi:hypothetical protein